MNEFHDYLSGWVVNNRPAMTHFKKRSGWTENFYFLRRVEREGGNHATAKPSQKTIFDDDGCATNAKTELMVLWWHSNYGKSGRKNILSQLRETLLKKLQWLLKYTEMYRAKNIPVACENLGKFWWSNKTYLKQKWPYTQPDTTTQVSFRHPSQIKSIAMY